MRGLKQIQEQNIEVAIRELQAEAPRQYEVVMVRLYDSEHDLDALYRVFARGSDGILRPAVSTRFLNTPTNSKAEARERLFRFLQDAIEDAKNA